jgi:hypothetical protein
MCYIIILLYSSYGINLFFLNNFFLFIFSYSIFNILIGLLVYSPFILYKLNVLLIILSHNKLSYLSFANFILFSYIAPSNNLFLKLIMEVILSSSYFITCA